MSKAYGAVPVISTEDTTTGPLIVVKNKQGHSCFGGCCDVRRAVIAVDLVMIASLLIDIFGILFFSSSKVQPLDDDELQAAMEHLHGGFAIFLLVLEIVLLSMAIWGALIFSARMVALGMAVFAIACVMSMMQFNLPAVVLSGLFAYPHYFLYQEINAGIMSQENYYNEEQSCCCV